MLPYLYTTGNAYYTKTNGCPAAALPVGVLLGVFEAAHVRWHVLVGLWRWRRVPARAEVHTGFWANVFVKGLFSANNDAIGVNGDLRRFCGTTMEGWSGKQRPEGRREAGKQRSSTKMMKDNTTS